MDYLNNDLLNEIKKISPNAEFLVNEYCKIRFENVILKKENDKLNSILNKIKQAKKNKDNQIKINLK